MAARPTAATRAVMLAMMALIAGCVAPAPVDGADASSGHGGIEPRLRAPLELPQDRQAREPNIAVMEDGTIFVTGQATGVKKASPIEGGSWLWRSRDDGVTWETLRSPYDGNPATDPGLLPVAIRCACDADVVVSPDGWAYYTDWFVSPYTRTGHFVVERSADGGDTWDSAVVVLPNDGFATVDRQWLLPGEDGFLALFYHKWDEAGLALAGAGAQIQLTISRDHGRTWSLPTAVAGEGDGVYLAQAHPRMLADGTLVTAYMELAPSDEVPCRLLVECSSMLELPAEVRVARSHDEGATWRTVHVAEAPEGVGAALPIGLAADASGRLLIAYNARTGDTITVFTVESADGGRTWGEPRALAASGINALPWASATPDGRFAVGWYKADATGRPEDVDPATPWHVVVAERAAPGDAWVIGLADPEPVHLGPACFGGDSCGDGATRALGDYLSVEHGPDGILHVAYVRPAPGPAVTLGGVELAPSRLVGHVWYARVAAADRAAG